MTTDFSWTAGLNQIEGLDSGVSLTVTVTPQALNG